MDNNHPFVVSQSEWLSLQGSHTAQDASHKLAGSAAEIVRARYGKGDEPVSTVQLQPLAQVEDAVNVAINSINLRGSLGASADSAHALSLADKVAGNPEENQRLLRETVQALTSDHDLSGSPLSPKEKLELHHLAVSLVQRLQLPALTLDQLSKAELVSDDILKRDSGKGFSDSKAVADKYDNVDLQVVTSEINLLARDAKTNPASSADYSSMMVELKAVQASAVESHLNRCSSDLLAGHFADGTPVNWDPSTKRVVLSWTPPLDLLDASNQLVRARELEQKTFNNDESLLAMTRILAASIDINESQQEN